PPAVVAPRVIRFSVVTIDGDLIDNHGCSSDDLTVIVACGAFAVALDESVTVRPSRYEPDTSGVNVGAGAVAFDSVALEPVGTVRVHAYVYGECPPAVVAPRVIRFPVVPLDGALIDTERGGGGDVTVNCAEAELEAASLELKV